MAPIVALLSSNSLVGKVGIEPTHPVERDLQSPAPLQLRRLPVNCLVGRVWLRSIPRRKSFTDSLLKPSALPPHCTFKQPGIVLLLSRTLSGVYDIVALLYLVA